MSTNISYANGFVQEGFIGSTKVYTSIESMTLDCPSCGNVITRDVWDCSMLGHEACGMVYVNFNCWDCDSQTNIYVHEGCIVCMETLTADRDNTPDGKPTFEPSPHDETPQVGSLRHGKPVGSTWNVAENRPMTWNELHPREGIGITDDDEIPF